MEPVTTETRVALVDELACREVLAPEHVAEAKALLCADNANPVALLTSRFNLPPREVLSAACAVTQLPPAPLGWLRGDTPSELPIDDDDVAAFLAIGAVPLGYHRGALCVAFADPERALSSVEGSLPPHRAHLALESDLRRALERVQGERVHGERVHGERATSAPPMPDDTVRTAPVSDEDDEAFSPRTTTVSPPTEHRFAGPTLVDAESRSDATAPSDFEDAPTLAVAALMSDPEEGSRAEVTVAARVERPQVVSASGAGTGPMRAGAAPLASADATWVGPPGSFHGRDGTEPDEGAEHDDEDLFDDPTASAPRQPTAPQPMPPQPAGPSVSKARGPERPPAEARNDQRPAQAPAEERQPVAPPPPLPRAAEEQRQKAPTGPRPTPRSGEGGRAPAPRGVGRYRTLGVLGRGGMATVYLAEDDRTGRRVALKLMEPHLADDETFVERFRREMKASASLTHQNIVRIFDCDEDGGTYYMAAELVDGGTLRDLLGKMGRLPAALAAQVLKQCLAGLAHAHEHGIVHRDLKPANVMITRDGIVKIGDFGIAKTNNDTTITQTGTLFGTPAYMSPEQATGKALDHRSDLFSIGTVVYELLTGKNPFTHENISTSLLLVSRARPAPIFEALPTIPPLLEQVLERLMTRDPDQRYQSATEAIAELEPLTRLVDRAHPDVVGRAVADEVATRDELLRDQAAREYERASALLRKAPPARLEAAFRLYKATLLDVSNYQAVNDITQLRIDHGFRFDPADPAPIRELEAALVEKPDSPALLRRGADLSAAQRDLLGSAAFMKRYLRAQPGDLHMLRRLHEIVGADALAPYRSLVDSQSTPATLPGDPAEDHEVGAPVPANVAAEFADLFKEGVQSLWKGASASVTENPTFRAAMPKVWWLAIAAGLVGLIGLGLKVTFDLTRSSVTPEAEAPAAAERSPPTRSSSGRSSPERPASRQPALERASPAAAPGAPASDTTPPLELKPEPVVGTWLAERAERQQKKLEEANRKLALGKLEEGMAELNAVVILDPSSELAARALVQRARTALELGRSDEARRDLQKVLRRVSQNEALREEAEALLARLPSGAAAPTGNGAEAPAR